MAEQVAIVVKPGALLDHDGFKTIVSQGVVDIAIRRESVANAFINQSVACGYLVDSDVDGYAHSFTQEPNYQAMVYYLVYSVKRLSEMLRGENMQIVFVGFSEDEIQLLTRLKEQAIEDQTILHFSEFMLLSDGNLIPF